MADALPTYHSTLTVTVFKTTVKVLFAVSDVADCVPFCERCDMDEQRRTIRDWLTARLTAAHYKSQQQPLSDLITLLKTLPGATSVEISEQHPEDDELVRGYVVQF
jgi:hypothetical protein